MKIDVTTVLQGLDGKPFKLENKDLTLRKVATEALMAIYQDEPTLDGETKFKRYKLASKFNGADEINLTPEEAAEAKKLIGKAFGPAVVGPVFELFDKA